MTLIITFHVIVCTLLIIIVLIQAGRGGGFIEGFSGMESIFGTKSNSLLTRTTAVLSILFFITCVSLAWLSAKQGQSLMKDIKTEVPIKQAVPVGESPKPVLQETSKTEEKTTAVQPEVSGKVEKQEQPKPEQVEGAPKTE